MASDAQPEQGEPGIDRHAFVSEYESLLADLEDSPEEVLPQLADLVGRMLDEWGQPGELGGELDESEQRRMFDAANELAERARDGEDLPPGDVAFAVATLQEVYRGLVDDGRTA